MSALPSLAIRHSTKQAPHPTLRTIYEAIFLTMYDQGWNLSNGNSQHRFRKVWQQATDPQSAFLSPGARKALWSFFWGIIGLCFFSCQKISKMERQWRFNQKSIATILKFHTKLDQSCSFWVTAKEFDIPLLENEGKAKATQVHQVDGSATT